MKLPKFLSKLKRKSTTIEVKQFKLAKRLTKKLFGLHVVKVILVLILLVLLSPIVIYLIYKPKVQDDINYGVTFSNRYTSDLGLDWKEVYITMLDELEVKNLRLVVYWDDVEAERDVYDFSDIMWQLDEAEKRDLNVILAMGRKVPRYPECFQPDWWEDMDNINYQEMELLEYIKVAIRTLKPYKSIKIWQVENEPFFKFGECDNPPIERDLVLKEIQVAKSLDGRGILVQDSGEGGFWFPAYQAGDYLGISMYRRIWYDFWGFFLGNFIYFKYPLAHWTYKIKADLTLVPHENIIVTELQAEPWGPAINNALTQKEKDRTMSRQHFLETISYAQKAGFKDYYFWGVEWWYWEKYENGNPFYWDTAGAVFSEALN